MVSCFTRTARAARKLSTNSADRHGFGDCASTIFKALSSTCAAGRVAVGQYSSFPETCIGQAMLAMT